ncbi:GNAT family N-acetyltransferase [Pedococcus sp. KACC 23699]|uniref:GNAT family N-acetyltransferase n=1 Tax=Pedococcus sp. KACC 23699 TaxID=3149228 RepID=A0AAU7JUY0_9MICO
MEIRLALPTDLASVQGIEEASDQVFASVMDVSLWGSAPTGQERATEPGFLLVAAEGDEVVGFAHVVDVDGPGGPAHLEQIAVLPDRSRRGVGSVLLEQACRYAAERGFAQVTLRTFRDVPWNAPFYAGHGFVVMADEPDWMGPLRAAEERIGLPRNGVRVAMVRPLT